MRRNAKGCEGMGRNAKECEGMQQRIWGGQCYQMLDCWPHRETETLWKHELTQFAEVAPFQGGAIHKHKLQAAKRKLCVQGS